MRGTSGNRSFDLILRDDALMMSLMLCYAFWDISEGQIHLVRNTWLPLFSVQHWTRHSMSTGRIRSPIFRKVMSETLPVVSYANVIPQSIFNDAQPIGWSQGKLTLELISSQCPPSTPMHAHVSPALVRPPSLSAPDVPHPTPSCGRYLGDSDA